MLTEWDRILREEWYSQERPDEIMLEFAASLKKKNKTSQILDLGCGAGRHLLHMARLGFEAHGADLSETGLNMTKQRLEKQKLESHLVKCSMVMLPYVDSCFDAVVCLHAIYHQKLGAIQTTLSEIHRILKNEGSLLMNFLSKGTHSYGEGEEIEKDTFVKQEGAEKGVLHYFADREEINRLFRDFKAVSLDLSEREVDGMLRSRWIVTAGT